MGIRLNQVAIAFDQLFNALFAGWADETISARAYRCSDRKRHWAIARKMIDKIFFWQKNHCFGAYLEELDRYQLPPAYQRPDPK